MNMKSKIFIILVAFISLTGCKKFLDVQPKDLKIPKTVKDYQDLLNGEGWAKTISGTSKAELFWLEFLTDDIDESIGTSTTIALDYKQHYSSFYVWRNKYDFNYIGEAESDYNIDTWTWLYRVVGVANVVLADIDDLTGNENERIYLKAEAHFFRALANYYIVNIWGKPYNPATASSDMGIPLKQTPSPELGNIARSTVQQCYDFILSDLAEAETLVTASTISKSVFHVSKGSVNLLQSRMYLYMQNWTKAKEYADKVITATPTLYDMLPETFSQTNRVTTYLNARNGEILFSYHSHSLQEQGAGTLFSSSSTGTSSTWYKVSNSILGLYSTNDKRLNAYTFIPVSALSGSRIAKTMHQESGASFFDYNLRISEAYLNRAEAAAQLNDLAGAVADYNALRAKRITGVTIATFADKATALANIYDERRRELFFQGHRWFDLRRTGMPSITHFYTPTIGSGTGATYGPALKFILLQNDPGYTIEVPRSELELNPALTAIGLAERLPQ